MLSLKKLINNHILNIRWNNILKYELFAAIILVSILFFGTYAIISSGNNAGVGNDINELSMEKSKEPVKKIESKAEKKQNLEEKIAKVRVKSGDSLSSILGKLHVENYDSYEIVKAINKIYLASKLKVGDLVKIHYLDISSDLKNKKIHINKVEIDISDTKRLVINKALPSSYVAELIEVELFSKLQVKSGKIKNSLYVDAEQAGIPAEIIMEFIRFYSFDLDFQRDIQKGDKFLIFYETFYNSEGDFIKNGDIIYCKFITSNQEFANYKYTTTKGSTLYFNDKGSSVTKALLRTPISGARMSSSFGYRKHPILGYNKLHTGVDFAARTGTPIFAAGSGTVDFIGWKGGYGKYIRIRHNSRYKTAYAHMSRFAKSLKKGSKVKQRQVIGYVGSTGRSTGPHLHYEVHQNGKAINPRTLRAESKVTLKGKELDKFFMHKGRIDFILQNAFAAVKL